jgi:3-oxosteroid 1-dehydrogenase
MIDRTADVPPEWDDEADVVIVGAGSAGLACAVVAAVEGLSVILLEKGDVVGGTTAVSGGGAWFPANRHTTEVGVDDSPEEALEYLRACSGVNAVDEILVALVEHGPATVEFLEDRAGIFFRSWPSVGGTIDYCPWLPGAKHGGRTLDPGKFTVSELGEWGSRVRTGQASAWLIDKLDYYANQLHTKAPAAGQEGRTRPHQLARGEDVGPIEFFASGSALIGRLLKAALEQGVTVAIEAPAQELIVDHRRVVGLRATRAEKPCLIWARHGVVMTAGGFGQNEELKRIWLTRPMEHTCAPDTITGDGHLMGAAIGLGRPQAHAQPLPGRALAAALLRSRGDLRRAGHQGRPAGQRLGRGRRSHRRASAVRTIWATASGPARRSARRWT